MPQEALQSAISAQAAIRSLLLEREDAVEKRLLEASQHLEDVIERLEADFIDNSKASSLSVPSQHSGNIASSEGIAATQLEYMRALTDLLAKKEEALERFAREQNALLRDIINAHEETIRHLTPSRQ